MSLSAASQQIVFLRALLDSLGFGLGEPSILLADNLGAISLAKNPIGSRRSKHIDIRHHYIRELVENDVIKLSHVKSSENAADMFTKNLGTGQFGRLRASVFAMGDGERNAEVNIEGAC